jgi:hypothetical protein
MTINVIQHDVMIFMTVLQWSIFSIVPKFDFDDQFFFARGSS